MKHKSTKACRFNDRTKRVIKTRDHSRCIFCNSLGHEVMHYIPASKLGLAIKENGAYGCIICHKKYDSSIHHERYKKMFREYLDYHYPGFDDNQRRYKKYTCHPEFLKQRNKMRDKIKKRMDETEIMATIISDACIYNCSQNY